MVTTETVQLTAHGVGGLQPYVTGEFACGVENEACAASDSLETECCLLIATPTVVTTGNLNEKIQFVKKSFSRRQIS